MQAKILHLSGKMKTIATRPQKRNIESIAYHNGTVLRTRRGVHAKLALMRLEEFLREYGEPGDTGTVYDMSNGSLYADCKVTVGKVITHIFRAISR